MNIVGVCEMAPFMVFFTTGSYKKMAISVVIQFLTLKGKYYHNDMALRIDQDGAMMVIDEIINSMAMGSVMTYFFLYQLVCNLEHTKLELKNTKISLDLEEQQRIFLLGFSHELRNPLNSLLGNLQLVLLEDLPEKIKQKLSTCRLCGDLLLNLINNILDRGKADVDDLELEPTEILTSSVISKLWGVSSLLIRERGLEGVLRVDKNLPYCVKLDSYRITQIILNLISNSVKATSNGTITITYDWISKESEVNERFFSPNPYFSDDFDEGLYDKEEEIAVLQQKYFTLSTSGQDHAEQKFLLYPEKDAGILKISVKDTGCGIKPEVLGKIFDLDKIKKDKRLATGLGLYINSQICTKMKGKIMGFSQLGKGSNFVVCLPIMPGEVKSVRKMSSLTKIVTRQNCKVLIVDDMNFNNQVMRSYFERLQVKQIDEAKDGLQAFHMYKHSVEKGNPYDLITMDVEMPVMDGMTASKNIRDFESEKRLEPCSIVMVSGNCGESVIRECLNERGGVKAQGFLKKPVCFHVMEETFNSMLNHSSSVYRAPFVS